MFLSEIIIDIKPMENNLKYKWSKIFASKRFGKSEGIVKLSPLEQVEFIEDCEKYILIPLIANRLEGFRLLGEAYAKNTELIAVKWIEFNKDTDHIPIGPLWIYGINGVEYIEEGELNNKNYFTHYIRVEKPLSPKKTNKS